MVCPHLFECLEAPEAGSQAGMRAERSKGAIIFPVSTPESQSKLRVIGGEGRSLPSMGAEISAFSTLYRVLGRPSSILGFDCDSPVV